MSKADNQKTKIWQRGANLYGFTSNVSAKNLEAAIVNGQSEAGLVFSKNSEKPGLHALIIGVSGYDHLRDATPPPVAAFACLQAILHQLSGPARSASDLATLLIDRQGELAWPLKTCRLALSPAQDNSEAGTVAGMSGNAPKLRPDSCGARFDDILAALVAWREDVAREPNGAALFYFAGHGIQRSRGDAVLLPADFLGDCPSQPGG